METYNLVWSREKEKKIEKITQICVPPKWCPWTKKTQEKKVWICVIYLYIYKCVSNDRKYGKIMIKEQQKEK